MKLNLSRRLAALCWVWGLLLAGCMAETPTQHADKTNRLDRSLYQAAESFEDRRDYVTAVSYYRNLYRRDKNDVGAIVGLSRGLRHLQQAREAQAIVLRALKEAPKNQDLRAELGKVQLALGEPLKAVDTLSRVDAELKGGRWDVVVALAVAHDRIGMYEQAERRYRQAMKLSPENAVVLNNYALSLAQAERLPEALEILERAAAMPEATPRMRQNLAMLYAMKGDLTMAEQYVRRDLPPDIADQNMSYYRQLRAGMVSGDKTQPSSGKRLASRLPNAVPPGKIVTLQTMPADRLPDRTGTAVDTAVPPHEAGKEGDARKKAVQPATAAPALPAKAMSGTAPAVAVNPAPEPRKAADKAVPVETDAPAAAPAAKAPAAPVADAAAAPDKGPETSRPPEETAMSAATRVKAVPTEVTAAPAEAAGKPAPAGNSSLEPVAADKGVSEIERTPAAGSRDGQGMPAKVKATEATAEKKEKSAIAGPVPDQTVKVAAKEPAVPVAAAPSAEAPPPGAKAETPQTAVAAVATTGYRLQLGSFRSMEGAEDLRTRLLQQHPDLLQGVELVVEMVTVPERGNFFRVNSRPMPDREMVDETCLRLAIRDVPCLLVTAQ